ncbi:MAG: 50S ribosomal protein L5 [Candidatus Hydrogenedentota bacterium]|mgnify:CR=1 FL=1
MSTVKEDVPRLEQHYVAKVRPELKTKLGLASIMAVPKIEKIVLNMGVGEATADAKALDRAVEELRTITGQQPKVTRAKKAEANFKLREGLAIGAKVTLRGRRMYEFLDRFISVVLPRVRDFRGVPTSGFDRKGNYSMGVKEQIIFPEINFDMIDKVRGMDITIVTTAKTDDDARQLLAAMGMPFRKKQA